jgi:hypothetical protein
VLSSTALTSIAEEVVFLSIRGMNDDEGNKQKKSEREKKSFESKHNSIENQKNYNSARPFRGKFCKASHF